MAIKHIPNFEKTVCACVLTPPTVQIFVPKLDKSIKCFDFFQLPCLSG